MTSPATTDQQNGFAKMTIAAFESRMGDQMTHLISRHGGTPLVAPSMQEIPLEDNAKALECGTDLLSGKIDLLILLTGVGTKIFIDVCKTRFPLEDIKQALTHTTMVVRGPKPVAALKELGLKPHLTVPEPNTWKDILHRLDSYKPEGLSGLTIGIQEYGTTNHELMEGLADRGAKVIGVPVYRWALPDNVEPLLKVLEAIVSGHVEVVMFTSAVQVNHIVELLNKTNDLEKFREALNTMMVASIGTITSQRLSECSFPVDFEPSHSKLGIFVKEASEHASPILHAKRKKA